MARASTVVWLVVFFAGCAERRAPGGADSGRPDSGATCGAPESAGEYGHCSCQQECPAGSSCLVESEGAPRGRCIRACDATTACPDGLDCRVSGEVGVCLPTCTTAADCPDGTACDGHCVPMCNRGSDCLSGTCDAHSAQCVPSPGTGSLLTPCVLDADCRSGLCGSSSDRCETLCVLSDPHCPEGGVCIAPTAHSLDVGKCRPACAAGTCALDGLVCRWASESDVACSPRDVGAMCAGDAVAVTAGRPCACDSDCAETEACALESRYPVFVGGDCFRFCASADDCPATHDCWDATATEPGLCRQRCGAAGSCGAGRICDQWDTGLCNSFCDAAADCNSGACDLYTRTCEPSDPALAAIGATCTDAADCRSGICLARTGAPTGMCAAQCRLGTTGACPGTAACIALRGDEIEQGMCAPTCGTTACATPGTTCQLRSGAMVCLP